MRGRFCAVPMNIIILDDYQDAVRKLECAGKLERLNAKVFTNSVKGIGQLAVRLRDAEILVLIRERSHVTRQLLERLPRLRMIKKPLIAKNPRTQSRPSVTLCKEKI